MEDLSLQQFCRLTASSQPVPGGGGVSALAGALAASLASMVVNLSKDKKKYQEYAEEYKSLITELEDLRESLLKAIEEDAQAFRPLAEAYSLPKETPGYEEKLESCLKDAAASPMRILKMICRIITIDERLALIGSKISVSDAACSVMLARGALYAAAINVSVNTRLMKDREYACKLDQETEEIVKEYAGKADKVYEDIKMRLK